MTFFFNSLGLSGEPKSPALSTAHYLHTLSFDNIQSPLSTAHYLYTLSFDNVQSCSGYTPCELTPKVPAPPPCQPPPGPSASFAASTFRLDCPFPLLPPQSIEMWRLAPTTTVRSCCRLRASFSHRSISRLDVSSNVSDTRASGVERGTRSSFRTIRE